MRFFVSAAIGAAAAAVIIAVRAAPSEPGPRAMASSPPITAANNKRHLARPELAAFLRWAARYRSCLAANGVRSSPPRLGDNEVLLDPIGRLTLATFAVFARKCDEGPPPRRASFVLSRDGVFHLYKPRACLLPVHRKP
jgi:hypothetical protein